MTDSRSSGKLADSMSSGTQNAQNFAAVISSMVLGPSFFSDIFPCFPFYFYFFHLIVYVFPIVGVGGRGVLPHFGVGGCFPIFRDGVGGYFAPFWGWGVGVGLNFIPSATTDHSHPPSRPIAIP